MTLMSDIGGAVVTTLGSDAEEGAAAGGVVTTILSNAKEDAPRLGAEEGASRFGLPF